MSEISKKESIPNQEIVVIEPEVITMYSGEIAAIHDGYVFINNVRRGYETIATNGDVFCPVPKYFIYQIGDIVEFENLSEDQQRVAKFRTENILKVNEGASSKKICNALALSKSDNPYHLLKKVISDGDLKKALKNKPLAELVGQIAWMLDANRGYKPEDVVKMANDYIKRTFITLSAHEVNYQLDNQVDEEKEASMIDKAREDYAENGLSGQSTSLKNEYAQFVRVRKAFNLMHEHHLLHPTSIIDTKHLPELTYAFPVWYVYSKIRFNNQVNERNPQYDHVIENFSNLVGSQEFAWLYQMYNRRTRPMDLFAGKDIMPPALVKTLKEAKQIFDFIVIMTPYHDVASAEWSRTDWPRNIDPIMVGFLNGLPQMFVLGRWSGTGVFPLLLDCVADTSLHLRVNKDLLYRVPNGSSWYKGIDAYGLESNIIQQIGGESSKTNLERFADRLLLAYDEGCLFEFLRGELRHDPRFSFSEPKSENLNH